MIGSIGFHHRPCKIYIILCRMGKTAPNLERSNYGCRPTFGSHVFRKQRNDCMVFLRWYGFKRFSLYKYEYVHLEDVFDGIFHVAAWLSPLVVYTNTSCIRAQMVSLPVCCVCTSVFRRKWRCDSALCRHTLLESVIRVLLTQSLSKLLSETCYAT